MPYKRKYLLYVRHDSKAEKHFSFETEKELETFIKALEVHGESHKMEWGRFHIPKETTTFNDGSFNDALKYYEMEITACCVCGKLFGDEITEEDEDFGEWGCEHGFCYNCRGVCEDKHHMRWCDVGEHEVWDEDDMWRDFGDCCECTSAKEYIEYMFKDIPFETEPVISTMLTKREIEDLVEEAIERYEREKAIKEKKKKL